MPEGHTIHRLAAEYLRVFGGGPVRSSSPQGRFESGAHALDGRVLDRTEAHGKHLFLGFKGPEPSWVHIHLGLYGVVSFGQGTPPPPVGMVRLRLSNRSAYCDLRGPSACELLHEEEKDAVHGRLGEDPLRPDDTGEVAGQRITRSSTLLAQLLMDQKVIAGVGNVYRAEILFRHGINPERAGRDISHSTWQHIWADLVDLMKEGVKVGRIDTVRPEHTPEAMGRPPRVDDHGGEVYVYRRTDQPCYICGTAIRTAVLAQRNLFWCPTCQRR